MAHNFAGAGGSSPHAGPAMDDGGDGRRGGGRRWGGVKHGEKPAGSEARRCAGHQ